MEPALLLIPALLACSSPPPPRPPNVLVVTLDTTRADALGVYGNTRAPTPRLDAFAGEAVRFTRAQTVTPLTIPAHSSIFTGLWPPRHGVRDNGDFFLSDGAVTLAERLHDAGYGTMASVGAEVTSHHWGFAQGFDAFYDDMGEAGREEENRWRVERRGDAVLADALGWLRERDPEQPWFAWVHLFDAHHPYEAPAPWGTELRDVPYLAEVAYVDSLVGELLDDLEARGELDRTWVLVTGDHGEGLGSHGEAFHGVLLYDATTRIPFLVRPPGGVEGRVVDFPVSLVDVTPTVLTAAGQPAPGGLDGLDLVPWLGREPPPAPARDVYVESLYAFHHYGWAPQRALVGAEHKLIDSTTDELYARSDALERTDLASSEPAIAEAMRGRIAAMVAEMEPVEDAAARAETSADRLAQLEALGYVAGTVADADPSEALPDPVERLPALRDVEAARMAIAVGDWDAALARVDAVLALDPGLAEVRVLKAQIRARQGAVDEAIQIVAALHQENRSSNSAAMLGGLYLRAGDPVQAAEAFEEAVTIDPYQARAWVSYLQTLVVVADLPRLEDATVRAVALLPDEPGIVAMHGVVLALRGDLPEAEAQLRRSLELDPLVPLSNHGLALLARQRGDAEVAEQHLLEEVRLHPPGIPSRRVLVEIYAEQRRFDEQLEQLGVIAASGPVDALTLHSQGQALFNLQRYDDAIAPVERCREAFPAYWGCALLQANVLKKLGREAEAQAAYEAAVALKAAEKR